MSESRSGGILGIKGIFPGGEKMIHMDVSMGGSGMEAVILGAGGKQKLLDDDVIASFVG